MLKSMREEPAAEPLALWAADAGARRRRRLGRWAIHAVLLLFALYYLAPLYVMIVTSLKSPEELREASILALPRSPQFQTWQEAWSQVCVSVNCGGMKPYFLNSLVVVIPAVVISTLIGAINGYALTSWSFPGSNLLFGLLLFSCFIPFQAIILPLAQLLGHLGLASTGVGLAATYIIYGLGFTTLFFRNFYVTVPRELVRAATIDGAGFFRIFREIMLPISLPTIVVTLIWQFTQIWNDFLFAVTLTNGAGQTATVALGNLVKTSQATKRYDVEMAAAILTGLPTLLVFLLAGKYFVRGLTAGAVKG
jgi:glucose/mannose transport system permease protein